MLPYPDHLSNFWFWRGSVKVPAFRMKGHICLRKSVCVWGSLCVCVCVCNPAFTFMLPVTGNTCASQPCQWCVREATISRGGAESRPWLSGDTCPALSSVLALSRALGPSCVLPEYKIKGSFLPHCTSASLRAAIKVKQSKSQHESGAEKSFPGTVCSETCF